MASKTVISSYIDGLLSVSGTNLPDAVILSGMEDIVHKVSIINPNELTAFEVETDITETPVELTYISPTLRVYENNNQLPRRNDSEHISNRYSMLNDYGNSSNYYIKASKLYVYPFDPTKAYTLLNVAYEIDDSDNLVFPDKYIYALALFGIMWITLSQAKDLMDDLSTTLADMDAEIDLNALTAAFDARMLEDDVEMAAQELGLIQAKLGAIASDRQFTSTVLQSIAGYTSMANDAKNRYNEFFGQVAQQ